VNQLDKLSVQENKLLDLISESETKTRRLRKQRRLLLKIIKDLGDRETQNIFELEMEEIVAEVFPLKAFPELLLLVFPRFLGVLQIELLHYLFAVGEVRFWFPGIVLVSIP
jgi:hypothetical protein